MNYNNRDILNWLLGNFAVSNQKGEEVRFPCPYCEYENFYFNINKKIGWCHKAKCQKKPTLKDLINIIGYSPEMAGYIPSLDNKNEKSSPKEIKLPAGCWSIIEKQDQWIIDCLKYRGVSPQDILEFDIRADDISIIVPVQERGKLLNYVRRFVDRCEKPKNGFAKGKRYRYHPGVNTNDYIFNWDEAKNWDHIVFVENTFNAIWLRDLNVTTNFGSFLSKKQQEKLVKSKCKQVTILWDEGANYSRPVKELKRLGIPAKYILISGQPDNHSKQDLELLINAARNTFTK